MTSQENAPCGPPLDARPEDITTWPRCGQCSRCEAEKRIDWSQVFVRTEPLPPWEFRRSSASRTARSRPPMAADPQPLNAPTSGRAPLISESWTVSDWKVYANQLDAFMAKTGRRDRVTLDCLSMARLNVRRLETS